MKWMNKITKVDETYINIISTKNKKSLSFIDFLTNKSKIIYDKLFTFLK